MEVLIGGTDRHSGAAYQANPKIAPILPNSAKPEEAGTSQAAKAFVT